MAQWQVSKTLQAVGIIGRDDVRDHKPSAEGGGEEEQQAQPRITRFLAKHSFAGPEQIESLLETLALEVNPEDQGLLRYDDVTCVHDDVTYVYDDVTYVHDDVTQVDYKKLCKCIKTEKAAREQEQLARELEIERESESARREQPSHSLEDEGMMM